MSRHRQQLSPGGGGAAVLPTSTIWQRKLSPSCLAWTSLYFPAAAASASALACCFIARTCTKASQHSCGYKWRPQQGLAGLLLHGQLLLSEVCRQPGAHFQQVRRSMKELLLSTATQRQSLDCSNAAAAFMAPDGLQACLSVQSCLLLVELLVLQVDLLRLCLQLSHLLQRGWQSIRAAVHSLMQSRHSFSSCFVQLAAQPARHARRRLPKQWGCSNMAS